MLIRRATDLDIPKLVELSVKTFEPFYEGYVRTVLEEEVFQHQHGDWRGDYHRDIPELLSPDDGRDIAIVEINEDLAGFIAWKIGVKPSHGEIYLLAVAPAYRRAYVARQLCSHAIHTMKSAGVEVVEIGTGGDQFHAPARALYESLGFTMIPVAAYLKRV